MAPPPIKVRGIRDPIPQGYVLGRASPGVGDVELIPAPGVQRTGQINTGVTSVALDMPTADFAVAGSPITGAGTLKVTLKPQNANIVWAGPASGAPGVPGFRALVAADLPALGYVTSVGLAAPGIFSVSGSPVTSSGTLTLSLATQASNLVWAGPSSGAAAAPTFRSLVAGDIPALSYVSSTSPQSANKVLAGPTSGGAVAPTFRSLVAGDIPALSYVTSVGLSLPGIFSVSGSPVTGSGTLTASLATQSANLVWAGPSSGGAAAPTFRALAAADVPNRTTTGHLELAQGSAVSLTTGAPTGPTVVLSQSLPAGDYELVGTVVFINSGVVLDLVAAIVAGSTAMIGRGISDRDDYAGFVGLTPQNTPTLHPSTHMTLNSTTTVNLIAQGDFSGTVTAFGQLRWRAF